MSQAGPLQTNTTTVVVPGNVATTFTTQSGSGVPAANILIIDAFDVSENNDNGIETKGGVAAGDPPGGGAANEVSIYLTNRMTGTVTTPGAALTTIITFPLGATPGTYYVFGNVQAFNSTGPASGSYSFSGGYRTSGAAAVELGIEFHDEFEDVALVTSDVFLSASANNVILQVQGVAATSINWNAVLEYRRVF